MKKTKILFTGIAAASIFGLVACSSGSADAGGTTAAGAAGSASASATGEPVTIDFWAWNQGAQQQADAFNAAHDNIKINFTKQPSNKDTVTALTNAVTAKSGVPCLVQSPSSAVTMLSKGLIQPITAEITPDKDKFIDPAFESQTVNGEVYGVPFGAQPTFMIINKQVYDANSVPVPKTWDDVTAAAQQLGPKGVAVANLAGEDPTTLITMANQAGATWFKIDGDKWVVDIDSPQTRQAAAVIQSWIDNDAVTRETYADIAAMAQTFDSGAMVNIPLSTWQLAAWQSRFEKTLGQWEAIPLPQYSDASGFVTPGSFNAYVVPEGCENVAAATEAGVWLATDPASIAISSNPTTGAGVYPTTPDAGNYVEGLLPATLLTNREETPAIIEQATDATRVQWVDPPSANYFDELVSQWAKAVNKEITMDDVVTHMQQWVVDDLQKQGISVESGS